MYKLNNNLEDEIFKQFIQLCFKHASYFSLTHNGYKEFAESEAHTSVLKQLEPFLLQELSTQHWHSHYVPKGYEIKINLYNSNQFSQEIILKNYDNLFLKSSYSNNPVPINMLPEDICFFKDNLLFLGTISHESICHLYLDNQIRLEDFENICEWEMVDLLDTERICINDLVDLIS